MSSGRIVNNTSMPESFQLEIVTPEKLVVKEAAEEAQIPGLEGYLGILPGHAPLITELGVGIITYRAGGTTKTLSVAWGFAEVLQDKVLVSLIDLLSSRLRKRVT